MTQTKAGITTPSTSPYPARQSGHPDLSELAGTEPVGPDPGSGPAPDPATDQPPTPDHASRPEGLRALRAVRHRRRVLSVACAALVAACLVITILIVGLARSRSSGPGAARSPSVLIVAERSPSGPFLPTHPSTQIPAPRRH